MRTFLLSLLWLPLSLIGQSDPLTGTFYRGADHGSGLVYFRLKPNGEYSFLYDFGCFCSPSQTIHGTGSWVMPDDSIQLMPSGNCPKLEETLAFEYDSSFSGSTEVFIEKIWRPNETANVWMDSFCEVSPGQYVAADSAGVMILPENVPPEAKILLLDRWISVGKELAPENRTIITIDYAELLTCPEEGLSGSTGRKIPLTAFQENGGKWDETCSPHYQFRLLPGQE
ncbi:MAG: hypothetical protein AAF399_27665 [Bacteroidota bacterium]